MSARERLRQLWSGEATGELLAGEDGMISIVALVTVVFFLTLAVLVLNSMRLVNAKIHAQNSADAVAVSSATQLARGMNAVTTVNHLMGELMALVVLHNAIGGERISERPRQDTTTLNTMLSTAYTLARLGRPNENTYNNVKKEVSSEATLLDAYKDLKVSLTFVYTLHFVGAVLEKVPFPPIVAVGEVLIAISIAMEFYINLEWNVLRQAENAAVRLDTAIKAIFNQILPAANLLARTAARTAVRRAEETASKIGKMNGGEGEMYYGRRDLPLVPDPGKDASSPDDDLMRKSQIVRATWPWVAFHRQLVFRLTSWMFFSRTTYHYRVHTDAYTTKRCHALYQEHGANVHLLVLTGMEPGSKGNETWTGESGSGEADEMFSVVGFSWQKAPDRFGPKLFPQRNPDGLACFAQALVYNANSRAPNPQSGETQPETGWDTLNWARPVSGSNAFEWPNPRRTGTGSPKAFPNWQVKLVPVSRLEAARGGVKNASIRAALQKLNPSSPLARTH